MVGDEAELFERYHQRLLRVTAYRCRTTPDNIEEACAFAWATLLRRSEAVRRETVFAYLKEVAQNEALRLERLSRGYVPLDIGPDGVDPDSLVAPGNSYVTPEALGEAMERLRALPENLQRVVGMRALGWRYADIAEELGISYTRVNGLLTRADDYLHRFRERELADRHARSARLRDIEDEPPQYVRNAIGKPPRFNRRRAGGPALLRDWRRLALSIEDHRDRHGIVDPKRALGPAARTPAEKAARDELRDRIDRFTYQRERLEARAR